jgi:esterase/lipase superfamily enzyme
MLELPPIASNIAIAAIALALYALAWWASSRRTTYERVAVRLGLAVLMLLPILAAAGLGIFHETPGATNTAARPPLGGARGSAPDRAAERDAQVPARKEQDLRQREEESRRLAETDRLRAEAERQKLQREAQARRAKQEAARLEAERKAQEARQAEAQAARKQAEAARTEAEEARKSERPAATTMARPPEPRVTMVPPPAAAPTTVPVSPQPAEAAKPPAPPQAPAELKPDPVPAAERPKWDVVPVFYGTDRNSDATPQRADYGSGRAKRLELGRALVTVPKSHEVPKVERPWVYRLPFTQIVLFREREDPARHFTMKEVKALSREEFLKFVRERLALSRDYKDHALVFVHGFNNSFDSAVYRTAQIAYDLQFDGAPFMYSWPSKGELGLQDYSYDRESTGQAEPYLKQFLQLVTAESGAKSVSVIAHSMGNQLLLQVLRDLKRSTPDGVVLSQVILAAPDVDRDGFEFLAKEIAGVSRGVTMLAASNDRALEVSRRFWGGVPRAGDVPTEGPVVIDGMDTIDVTSVSTEVFSLNHSGYAEKQTLLNDIRLLIQTGERPPEKRIPILARITTPKGAYWRYP